MNQAMNKTIRLGEVAHARSGDKGNHANIGVVAYTSEGSRFLCRELTAERVQQFFQTLGVREVERFELPKVGALNFLLRDALGGGASGSLRIDTQGKVLGQAILELQLPEPDGVEGMRRNQSSA